MAQILRILIPLIILGLGYWGYQATSEKEPAPRPQRPEPKILESAATTLEKVDYQVHLSTQGIVQPHNETSLTSRVSGQITLISPKFESGSFFKKGEILIELDPSDFEAALSAAEARLARAEASLAQEEARAEQALLDWRDLGYTEPPTELVLRKPQLKETQADVKAANAGLTSAQRDLDRTKVRAPYDGRVKERLIGLGQSINSGTKLGDIFSTAFAEVRLPLSIRELSYVKLPNNPGDASVPVTLTDALTTENPTTWKAQVVRTEGTLDEESRKLFVIARINDPFSLKNPGTPSMRIGQPIRAVLPGETIADVFIIPRIALRRPNEIAVIDPIEFTLARRKITPIWSDEENLIVRENLTDGWLLSTSRLPNVPIGAPVKVLEPDPTIEPEETEEPKAVSTPSKKAPDA